MLDSWHTQGVERLKLFVSQFPEWRELLPGEYKLHGSSFIAGWELPRLCDDQASNLRILITQDFPFKLPRIAVFPFSPKLTWPNLEDAGILCLRHEGSVCSIEQVEDELTFLLRDARDLVNEWHSGKGLERFEDEFQSYWDHWQQHDKNIISLCSPNGDSRWVSSFNEKKITIVADDEETLKSWVRNYFTPDSEVTITTIPLIKLQRPPHPNEYPDTPAKLLSLIAGDKVAWGMLEKHVRNNQKKSKKVMFAFPGRRGFGFAGLLLPSSAKGAEKGFRKGNTPLHILVQRFTAKPVGIFVKRCDASWVHGRDHNPDVKVLTGKTVLLLGVGSLGSGVAELLAKMGVGKIILVDPEIMAPENSSRHSLGIRSMDLRKASELARNLSKRFPHLQFISHALSWENCHRKSSSIFTSADLIVSTIGSWPVESMLNILAISTVDFPPVLYGWLEEHAAAGHAVVFFKNNGCLRCLADDKGQSRLPVTIWPEEGTLKHVPLCGGLFQPCGAIELAYAHGLVADLAADILLNPDNASVHRTWIGQKKLLESGKGEWNPDWISFHGHPEDGGRIVNLTVIADPGCPVCGENR